MLSEQEKHEIEEELKTLPQRRAALPEALKAVQRHRGWVSDEAVRDIADYLGVTPAEVDSIATFYSVIHRKPVGRHVIWICDSVSCWITGFPGLLEHFKKTLGIAPGETTADGRFTLLPNACLGLCEQAPAMMVDRDPHGNLTPEKIDQILSRYP
jgi:NADH-quinone oxidoreductase subunit E